MTIFNSFISAASAMMLAASPQQTAKPPEPEKPPAQSAPEPAKPRGTFALPLLYESTIDEIDRAFFYRAARERLQNFERLQQAKDDILAYGSLKQAIKDFESHEKIFGRKMTLKTRNEFIAAYYSTKTPSQNVDPETLVTDAAFRASSAFAGILVAGMKSPEGTLEKNVENLLLTASTAKDAGIDIRTKAGLEKVAGAENAKYLGEIFSNPLIKKILDAVYVEPGVRVARLEPSAPAGNALTPAL